MTRGDGSAFYREARIFRSVCQDEKSVRLHKTRLTRQSDVKPLTQDIRRSPQTGLASGLPFDDVVDHQPRLGRRRFAAGMRRVGRTWKASPAFAVLVGCPSM